VKWTFKDKNLQQSCHFKVLETKKCVLGKFQCTSPINYFDDDLFFIFTLFDMFFEFAFFIFSV